MKQVKKRFCVEQLYQYKNIFFDGGAGKIGLETKNIVACTSFVVEQKLIKAWLADKDAEALRCQKLLMEEEEEAAQRRLVELLERKRQKKMRHKEQKAEEQRQGEKVDVLRSVLMTCWRLCLKLNNLAPWLYPILTRLAQRLCQMLLLRADEDVDLENQIVRGGERSKLQGNSHRHMVVARWHAPSRSQRDNLSNGFHASQNSQARVICFLH